MRSGTMLKTYSIIGALDTLASEMDKPKNGIL